MRLEIIRKGQNFRNRLALRILGAVAGGEPDDVIVTSMYRPGFFGRPWLKLARSVMRGPSDWTPGERELFAAFTSRLNTCHFCAGIHVNTTKLALDSTITKERLDNWRTAGFEPRILSMLELLEKFTLSPSSISPDDILKVRAAGVSDNAIVDGMHVCFVFNLINRLANALDYNYGSESGALKAANIINRLNYQFPEFLLR